MSAFSSAPRALSRLQPSNAVLFICDMQERFRPLIHKFPSAVNRCTLMTNVSNTLSIPALVTEQYSKVFGKTIPELPLADAPVFEKKKFSMMTDEFKARFTTLDRKQIIMCGIEAHVCVLQTTLDLLADGFEVHVVCDAVSSQRPHDRAVALTRMAAAGAVLTTAESAVFDLVGSAEHPQFKAISGLVKASNDGDMGFSTDAFP